jgi:hypothetical protein
MYKKLCSHCNKLTGCIYNSIIIPNQYEETEYERVPFESCENEDRCPICYAINGRYHHVNCFMEHCPKCRKQLRTCNCNIHSMLISHSWNNTGWYDKTKDEELSSQINRSIYNKNGYISEPDRDLYDIKWDSGKKVRLFGSSNYASEFLTAEKYDVR